jgi:phosphoribosyl 1,2-cyclic phosphodiesterase
LGQDRRHEFYVRCWGTRGSLPAARPSTNRYGGNTPCLEIRAAGRLLIFDAGSGIRSLGEHLRRTPGRIEADIFFTHYHWDHIHGFPFFAPAYAPENLFRVWGERRGGRSVKDILAGQMAMPYFPVPLSAMRAQIDLRDVGPGQTLELGPATIRTQALNHPGKALSYRIEHAGKAIVYATDTEHGARLDERLVRHAAGADILIYDAAYTDQEIRHGRKGWGHSTWREGVKVARAAGVRTLLLFHHEPSRDDRALAAIERTAQRQFRRTWAAREGHVYRP